MLDARVSLVHLVGLAQFLGKPTLEVVDPCDREP